MEMVGNLIKFSDCEHSIVVSRNDDNFRIVVAGPHLQDGYMIFVFNRNSKIPEVVASGQKIVFYSAGPKKYLCFLGEGKLHLHPKVRIVLDRKEFFEFLKNGKN